MARGTQLGQRRHCALAVPSCRVIPIYDAEAMRQARMVMVKVKVVEPHLGQPQLLGHSRFTAARWPGQKHHARRLGLPLSLGPRRLGLPLSLGPRLVGAIHINYCGRVGDNSLAQRRPILWFVGLTTLDVIHRGAAPQHRNQKVTATWQGICEGGPAANAAVVASTLGADVTLFTALGVSPAAQIARADLESHGIRIVDFADGGFELGVSAILVDEATSERSVVSLDGGLHDVAAPADFDLSAYGALPDAVLIDGHHPNLARAFSDAITEIPKPGKPLLVLDGGRWKEVFYHLISDADVAALSSEFQIPGPYRSPNLRFNDSPLAHLRDYGTAAVVVTNGAEPVIWEDETGHGAVDVPQVTAVDTLGAGDAWHGALTYYLAIGQPLPTAIAQANDVAALKVQYLGNREWLKHLRK